jgi:deazaflavin-dependent oxidoreductase (nitroreductase family)
MGLPMVIAASVLAVLLLPILLVRFFRREVAAFHRVITNRIAIHGASRFPGFGVITNVGRKSGTFYRTPVNVFRVADGFLIALTYGRESGWVRNVVAAGACELETRRVLYRLSSPVIVQDASHRRFPIVVRVVLRLIAANDYLQLSTSRADGGVVNSHSAES